jgi:type I restriction enzyme S subunit
LFYPGKPVEDKSMARFKFDDIAINSTEKKKPTEADKNTYLGLEHLDSGNLTVTRFGSDVAPIGEKLIMKKGDILFGKRRAYQKKVAIAPFDGIFSAHGMVLRPKEAVIDRGFFPLFIRSDYFLDAAIKISVGSLSPTINWNALKELEFNLPSLENQKRLATLLWAVIQTKSTYKRLQMLTDQLVKSRFIEMFGDPVRNEKGWKIKKLSELSIKISDGVHARPAYTNKGMPFISVVNITKGFVDFSECKHVSITDYEKMVKSTNPEFGDILYTKVGTYGIPAFVDTHEKFCLYVSVCLIKPNNNKINARFLATSMGLPYIKNQADERIRGIGVPDLHLNQIREFDILCPPLDLQNKYVNFVEQADKSKFIVSRLLKFLFSRILGSISEKGGFWHV